MKRMDFQPGRLAVAAGVCFLWVVICAANVQARPQPPRPHSPGSSRAAQHQLLQQQRNKSAAHALARAAGQQSWRNHLEQGKKSAQHLQQHRGAAPISGFVRLWKRGWHKLGF